MAAAKSGTKEKMKKHKSCRAAIEGNTVGRGELPISDLSLLSLEICLSHTVWFGSNWRRRKPANGCRMYGDTN
jgi:hypothetical protein